MVISWRPRLSPLGPIDSSVLEWVSYRGGGRMAQHSGAAPRHGTVTTVPLLPGQELRDEFTCPITRALMRVPVIAADGHTYDRAGIERWLLHHSSSPKVRWLSRESSRRRRPPPRVTVHSPFAHFQASALAATERTRWLRPENDMFPALLSSRDDARRPLCLPRAMTWWRWRWWRQTGEPLEHRHLVPNHNLKRLIDDLVAEGGSGAL